MGTIEQLYQIYVDSDGVSTDTRTIRDGQVYFALSGENFDGNKFAEAALDKGAVAAVVSDTALSGDRYFHVADTLLALQQLATHHRRQLTIPVLGITGSNGKTTTKELITTVLSRKYNVVATKGNLNNHIGVPLSLLGIHADHEFAVIEMGANHVGEIRQLCTFAMPTHGVITNIGRAHIEGFGGLEGIKRGKSELYDSLAESDGLAFVNMNERFLDELSARVTRRVRYAFCDTPGLYDYCFLLLESQQHCSIKADDLVIDSDLFGVYNAYNISTALAIGSHFGVPMLDIRQAISAYNPTNNRSQVVEVGGCRVLLDAYNANPTSMKNTLETFRDWAGSKAVILGGMNELGNESAQAHQELIDLVMESDIDRAIFVGDHYESSNAEEIEHYQTTEQLCEVLKGRPITQQQLLVKGSRSFKLESVLDYL